MTPPRPRPPSPDDAAGARGGVSVRAMTDADWPAVRRIYAEGIATGRATFTTAVPATAHLDATWLPGQRWVAELDGSVAGWAAITPVSARACYAGVGETTLYVAAAARGRGLGGALLAHQVAEADAGGLWTLQATVLATNPASLALHRSGGFRTVGVRERIAQLDGVWHDTVLLERRSPVAGAGTAPAAG